jgi:hypothetical protein
MSTSKVPVAEPTKVVTSVHGSTIGVLAVTADGEVAATADARSVRLWPSLDGKHEPVVVAMRPPKTLAIARDGDAIVVAGLDAVGQLELVRVTAEGEPLSRATAASPRPIREIHAMSRGVLALRDDDAIALYGASGTLRGELAPNPRQRVRSLAVNHDHALAIIETEHALHGEWLDVEADGVWFGLATPVLALVDSNVAQSANGKRISGRDKRGDVVIIDVASGRVVERRKFLEDEDQRLRVIGFLDSGSLAVDSGRSYVEVYADWDFEDYEEVSGLNFVAADGVVVGAEGSSLVIGRKGEATQYLGYQMAVSVSIVPRGDGFLMTDGASVAEIGPDLRARKVFELAPKKGVLENAQIIDENHVVTAFGYGYDNPAGSFLADVKTGKVTPIGEGFANYNRERGLLALMSQTEIEVRRFDRKKGQFGPPGRLHLGQWAPIQWLDSKRGDFAVTELDFTNRTVKLDVFRLRDDLERLKEQTIKPSDEWWETSQDTETVLDASWRPTRRRPSPDGKLVAEVRSDGRMTLQNAAGEEQWMVFAAGATDVAWTKAGQLFAFGSGIARLDLATGALRERQCGWQFGLWPERPLASGTSALCEAP